MTKTPSPERPSTPTNEARLSNHFEAIQNTYDSEDEVAQNKREQLLESLRKAAEERASSRSADITWPELLGHSFLIGEIHTHINPKKFLIENMNLLSGNGYNTIFFEHLYPELEESLKEYSERSGRDTPENLKSRLSYTTENYMDGLYYETFQYDTDFVKLYKDQASKYNYNSLIRKASELGIKVVPIEISEENYTTFAGGPDRMIYLNSNAMEVIKREQAANPNLKYFGLIGMSHLLSKYEVPGIAEVLGVQDLAIFDAFNDGSLQRKNFPRVIYDPEIMIEDDKKYLKGSRMGFACEISENVSFIDDILPRRTEALKASKSSSENTPHSSIESLKNPKRLKAANDMTNERK